MPIVSSNRNGMQVVHLAGPRPTPKQLAREVRDVTVAAPLFAIAPLVRHWHRRWGATYEEVAAPKDWVPMFSKVNDTHCVQDAAIKPAEELVRRKPDGKSRRGLEQ